ncbi:MAG: tryptophan halogenase family protein [Sphingomicrobium sp.]
MMERPIERIVIAGGGTAGWLSACRLAAWVRQRGLPIIVTLVEDPDTPTIGVGEGTWPTMRQTLSAIGIDEADFLLGCDASFKQGSQFDGWRDGGVDDRYLHPFTLPPEGEPRDLVEAWRSTNGQPFAGAMTSQDALVAAGLAPRQRTMAPFAGAMSYGYHLDAGKFAQLLSRHGTERLGVVHRQEKIVSVIGNPDRIEALTTAAGEHIPGDLFVDCTGFAAVLIERHCGSGWVDQSAYLLNDRALAVQVAVDPDSPIASATRATAHEAGWFWDIGLPTRRGIGCVYSSAHLENAAARRLLDTYVAAELGQPPAAEPRLIQFPTGHRDRFWIGNCLAIGLSAGFIEPLEASAIVLIESSLDMLIEGFPAHRRALPSLAQRFDRTFTGRWQSIVEFLKLHYVLSRREEPYWAHHRDPATIPPRLVEHLVTWADQPPSQLDFPLAHEMFPAASYQYVYYGMGGATSALSRRPDARLIARLDSIRQKKRSLVAALPTNRSYLAALAAAPSFGHAQGEGR